MSPQPRDWHNQIYRIVVSPAKLNFGFWDCCRCYRHCETKSRSPGISRPYFSTLPFAGTLQASARKLSYLYSHRIRVRGRLIAAPSRGELSAGMDECPLELPEHSLLFQFRAVFELPILY